MTATAIVTGGTGGLGAAVVARLLDDGWRVGVPWIAERELERVRRREGRVPVGAADTGDGSPCNATVPSVIDAPGNRASMPDADHDRWVKPEQIAGVIAHLLSDESAPTSGAAIPVYGRA